MLPARDKSAIMVAMACSVAIHTALFTLLSVAPGNQPVENQAFAVMLVEPPALRSPPPTPVPAPKQMVSPSQAPEIPPPVETARLSERDSSTLKEQIKRGEPGSATRENKAPAPQPPAPPQPVKEQKQEPATRNLRLGGGEILNKLGSGTKEAAPDTSSERVTEKRLAELESAGTESKTSNQSTIKRLDNYTPFSKTSFRNLFTGPSGSPDYLPELPDGDITLLNAKANAYAVFVRRVALQVFSALRSQSWSTLPFSEIQKLREFSIIEAIMDKNGKLDRVRIQDSSGSTIFDQVVQTAASKGTWDQNPPGGAALDDGKIHFAFHARTWARPPVDTRGEQRWLLLGTELK